MIYYVGATWWSLIIEYQLGIKNKPCLTDGYETGTKYKDLRCTFSGDVEFGTRFKFLAIWAKVL